MFSNLFYTINEKKAIHKSVYVGGHKLYIKLKEQGKLIALFFKINMQELASSSHVFLKGQECLSAENVPSYGEKRNPKPLNLIYKLLHASL